MRIRGETALVTGAALRIGRTIALALAAAGARVAVHFRKSEKPALRLVRAIERGGGRAVAVQGDLFDLDRIPGIVDETARRLGRPTILVNNASEYRAALIESVSGEEWERMLRVNLTAPLRLAQAVVPHMRARGRGKIVNLGDIDASAPRKRYGPYCVSKAGIHALTLSLARELAPAVQVNAVVPGAILLPPGSDPALERAIVRRTPAGRIGDPSDVAEAVLYFVRASGFVTGQILAVDGGRSLDR